MFVTWDCANPPFLCPQWTSEAFESMDGTNSNIFMGAKDNPPSIDRDRSSTQGTDRSQDDSALASAVQDLNDQKTV